MPANEFGNPSFLSRCLSIFILILPHSALVSLSSTSKPSRTIAVPHCWEAELWEVAEPLEPAPPSLAESLEILKRDGVVRLNPGAFRVEEDLCTALRDRILAEIEKTPVPKDLDTDDDYVDKYVPGTRLRPGEGAIDLTFGGDLRHDVLLPLDDKEFSEVNFALESAARQLEPLLLAATEQLLPRLHGSNSSGNAYPNHNSDNELKMMIENSSLSPSPYLRRQILESGLSAEVVEVASLVVRHGSGHQAIHGDYRRFSGGDETNKNEEPISHTEARDGKMPPRIVTFVALQDIPSNEHGSTGFITGTHNSHSHELVYGEFLSMENDIDIKKKRLDVLESSTSGVRTTRGFQIGEMLIYDASVLHWGGANSIVKNDRVILYFGVSRTDSAAQLGRSQPRLKGFEIVPPISLQDFVDWRPTKEEESSVIERGIRT